MPADETVGSARIRAVAFPVEHVGRSDSSALPVRVRPCGPRIRATVGDARLAGRSPSSPASVSLALSSVARIRTSTQGSNAGCKDKGVSPAGAYSLHHDEQEQGGGNDHAEPHGTPVGSGDARGTIDTAVAGSDPASEGSEKAGGRKEAPVCRPGADTEPSASRRPSPAAARRMGPAPEKQEGDSCGGGPLVTVLPRVDGPWKPSDCPAGHGRPTKAPQPTARSSRLNRIWGTVSEQAPRVPAKEAVAAPSTRREHRREDRVKMRPAGRTTTAQEEDLAGHAASGALARQPCPGSPRVPSRPRPPLPMRSASVSTPRAEAKMETSPVNSSQVSSTAAESHGSKAGAPWVDHVPPPDRPRDGGTRRPRSIFSRGPGTRGGGGQGATSWMPLWMETFRNRKVPPAGSE